MYIIHISYFQNRDSNDKGAEYWHFMVLQMPTSYSTKATGKSVGPRALHATLIRVHFSIGWSAVRPTGGCSGGCYSATGGVSQ